MTAGNTQQTLKAVSTAPPSRRDVSESGHRDQPGQSPAPLVQVRDVYRRFKLGEAAVDALNGVSLDIRAGEFLAVWGPSGSGKSTLMNMLGLIDSPTQGEVRFEGVPIRDLSDNALTDFRGQRIGFVFQSFNLVPVLSALENVTLPLEMRGEDKGAARERAARSLAEVGLERFSGSRPDQLSGGQRQRVAIARALAISPQLVIADEPTANLDSENSRMVVELRDRKSNRTAAAAGGNLASKEGAVQGQSASRRWPTGGEAGEAGEAGSKPLFRRAPGWLAGWCYTAYKHNLRFPQVDSEKDFLTLCI